MKIDFNAAYSKINQLLNRPDRAPEEPGRADSFQKTLAGISPEPAKINRQSVAEPLSAGSSTEGEYRAMASYSFDALPLPIPLAEQLNPVAPDGADPVNPADSGVKTPTVVRVRRVGAEELAALPQKARMQEVEQLVTTYGRQYGVDPLLGMAVVSAESSFNPLAVSRDGHYSKGLFQLLDTTGKDLIARASLSQSYDPFNPEQNVDLGVYYLRYLHDLFHSPTDLPNNMSTVAAADSSSLEKLAVAAFNAGEGRVASAQNRAISAGKDGSDYAQVAEYLPGSTREYVDRVMRFKQQNSN